MTTDFKQTQKGIHVIKASVIQTKTISLLIVAFKMLVHSRKKFIGMLIGATFSAFIVMQQPGTYQGISDRLIAQIESIKEADLWVMGKESYDFSDPVYFNSMDIYRIRTIPGVLWAKKLYRTWYSMTHIKTNKTTTWELVGVDAETLTGLPQEMLVGDRASIQQVNSIIIDGYALKQLETTNHETIKIGDRMVEGQRNWIVTAITKPLRTYRFEPKAYVLSNHIPAEKNRPYFILVKAKHSADINQIASQIHKITAYDALTPRQFTTRALKFFSTKTPIIIIFTSIAILGFTIGLIIMWQIFSNFILTHSHQFGMLKMLGVSNSALTKMVFFQATIIGSVGYIIGFILALLFGIIFHDTTIAFHLTWSIALQGALGTLVIIVLSSFFSILKVLRLDTVDLCQDLN